MNLNESEKFVDAEFAKHLSAPPESDAAMRWFANVLMPSLERLAITHGIEVCKAHAYLLVLGLYDQYLADHAEELGVDAEYFTEPDREREEHALAYLSARRLGAPASHGKVAAN